MKNAKERMQKSVNVLKDELATIRAGRANPAVLDKITVDYYGTQTPITQVGNVSVPEPRTLAVQPWDASVLKLVEKAIQKSDLGVNPQNDGKIIRITFPPLTEDRRKDLVKGVHKTGEEAKVAIRAIRRDFIDVTKDQKKKGDITEDDVKDAEEKIQKETDKFIKEIDEIIALKEKEIMEV